MVHSSWVQHLNSSFRGDDTYVMRVELSTTQYVANNRTLRGDHAPK